jgi:hypothetical protein
METCSKYISWPSISARLIAGIVGVVVLTKATSLLPDILTRKGSKDCVLRSESLCIARRQPESPYDLLQILTRPWNVIIFESPGDSI